MLRDENGNSFHYEESRRVFERLDRDFEREPRRTTTTLIPKAAGVEQPPVNVGDDK